MKFYNLSERPPTPYQFEKLIGSKDMKKFLQRYWHYCFYISALYIIVIHLIRNLMKSRPAYILKHASLVWNSVLAIFSICITIRSLPFYYFLFTRIPFYYVICDLSLYENSPQFVFWGTLFLFSKVWELGDTLFILLRKRNLQFLHYFHHIVTLIVLWYCSFRKAPFAVFLGSINTFVHSFMYTYFAVKCMGIKIPVKIAMFITTIQLFQMIFAVFFSVSAHLYIIKANECDSGTDTLMVIYFMFLSYVILFSNLFYEKYVKAVYSRKKTN